MRAKAAALAAILGVTPATAFAGTAYTQYAAYSATWFPEVYVRTGGALDIQLDDGERLTGSILIGDSRWITTSVTSGPRAALHVLVKTADDLPDAQLLTIPTTRHQYHVLLRSGPREQSAYTLAFYDKEQVRAAKATPRPSLIVSCSSLRSNYRISGDKRIPIESVCDDGTRTYISVRGGGPAVLPYRVDAGGHQDQLVNHVFYANPGSNNGGQWSIEGTFERLALLSDSSRGQIRVNIAHEQKVVAFRPSPAPVRIEQSAPATPTTTERGDRP